MHSILDWAISFLSESSQGTIRAIYFEGKTVKQHREEEYVTVYAIYKRPLSWVCLSAQGTVNSFAQIQPAVSTTAL